MLIHRRRFGGKGLKRDRERQRETEGEGDGEGYPSINRYGTGPGICGVEDGERRRMVSGANLVRYLWLKHDGVGRDRWERKRCAQRYV